MMEALLRLGLNNTQFQACISLAGLLCVFHFHHLNLLLLTSSLCIPFRRNSLSLFTHELGTLQLCTRFCKKVFQLWHRSPRREQAVQVCLSVLIWGDEVQVHLGRGSCGDLIRWRSLPCSVRISVRNNSVVPSRTLTSYNKLYLFSPPRGREGWSRCFLFLYPP